MGSAGKLNIEHAVGLFRTLALFHICIINQKVQHVVDSGYMRGYIWLSLKQNGNHVFYSAQFFSARTVYRLHAL